MLTSQGEHFYFPATATPYTEAYAIVAVPVGEGLPQSKLRSGFSQERHTCGFLRWQSNFPTAIISCETLHSPDEALKRKHK
jgi:hypothetical protein